MEDYGTSLLISVYASTQKKKSYSSILGEYHPGLS